MSSEEKRRDERLNTRKDSLVDLNVWIVEIKAS